MYETVLILDGASAIVKPQDHTVGTARCSATRPNDFVAIALDRSGRSCIVIRPREKAPAIADAGSALSVAGRAKSWPRTTNSLALSPLANAQAQLRAIQ